MEHENQDSGLFGLNIDHIGRGHLTEAARWANFLAIIGFIFVGLIAVIAIFGGSFLSGTLLRSSRYNSDFGSGAAVGFTIGIIIYYLLIALLVFFSYLFLYRFAVNMKMALRENSQDLLNRSFQNLKILYRYLGILMIIGLSFFVLALLLGILTAATT
jgi:hypothetical protein